MLEEELEMEDKFSLEAKLYDKIWGKYNYDSDVEFLNEMFRKHCCKKIIDLGCGTGNHAIRLSKLGYEVTGVDISPTMLKIAKEKDKKARVKFIQGDMKNIEKVILKKFDAAICLGQAFSSLVTNKEIRIFFKELNKVLKRNGLFIFNARNAKKINEDYLNTIRLGHMLSEKKLQLLILECNTRHPKNRNVIVWRPIYLIKENDKVDLQLREHKLRWIYFSTLKKMLIESRFEIIATYSGVSGEKFCENEHTNMLFVTRTK
jgi:ubiquinone/menaquinone biosynthesis C-methylase UbiE